MKITIIKLFLFFLTVTQVFGQSSGLNPTFDTVEPPSPNAASLGKFGSIPVGLSTGVPSVSVPIFTWDGKNFGKTVNISLDYHAGGVKVDELASNVGLGWALNGGGVITRTVRGIYDEWPDDGFLYKAPPADETSGNGPTSNTPNTRHFNRMHAGLRDSQNDLFDFNFNGRSGRFVLGRNGDILLLDQSKLQILKTITADKITKFTITDEYGYKYEFEDYETTMISAGNPLPPHTSAWYLTRITHPTGNDKIVFEYEAVSFSALQVSRSQTVALPLSNPGNLYPANMGGNGAQTINGKRLKKINFTDGVTITFQYKSTVRTDITTVTTDKPLEKIVINKGTASYGFLLTQDYSVGGRLTLKSVQQYGSSEQETINPYQFFYNMNYLPPRFNSMKDHWGYPNNNPSQDMIPREFIMVGGSNGDYGPYREFTGGNRDSDPTTMKAGSLTKVVYPTGGYTEFEMEANQAVDPRLIGTKTVSIPVPPGTYDASYNFGFNSTGNPVVGTLTYIGEPGNKNFTLRSNRLPSCGSCALRFELSVSPNHHPFKIVDLPLAENGGSNETSITFSLAGLSNGDSFTVKTYLTNWDFTLNGRKDTYGELIWLGFRTPGTTVTRTFGNDQMYVGGLRAKKITDYTSAGIVASTKEYEYVSEDGASSSGTLGYYPVYSFEVKYGMARSNLFSSSTPYSYVVRSSNSVNEIPLISGSPVTYKRVIEKTGQNGVYIGKTVRVFSSFADGGPYVSPNFPSVPTQYNRWRYGQLKSEEIYDSANILVKKTENQYTDFPDSYSGNSTRVENFRSIAFAPVVFESQADNVLDLHPDAYPLYFKMLSYFPIAGSSKIKQNTVTDYVGGQVAQKVVTDFTYDMANFYLKDESTKDSKGNNLKTVYTYPADMVTANEDVAIYSGMVGLNIIDPVIKETQFTGTTQTFSKITKYKNWVGSLYAPELVITKSYDNPERIRLRYLSYDKYGSPVSLQREGGPKTTYIWGYGGERLVATIQNSPVYSSVTALLSNVETFRNNQNPTDAVVNTFLAPLVTGLPEAQISRNRFRSLSGMVSSTDSKGMTVYYEYDSHYRLKNIKDDSGAIVKSYDYHFRQ